MTVKARRKYLDEILIQTFLGHFIPLILFFVLFGAQNKEGISLVVFFGWLLFFATPTFVLFYYHMKSSIGRRIILQGGRVEYFDGNSFLKFTFDEIKRIELNLSPPSYDKRVDYLFFGRYFFTSFHLKSGKVIHISCLLLDRVQDYFPETLIERKRSAFPIISNSPS